MNRIDLQGRNAVITGGCSGLGYAAAERFLRSGARIMIWDRSAAELDAARGRLAALGPVEIVIVDVSDFEAVGGAAAQAEALLGGIDILVNSAGITRPPTAFSAYPVQDWKDILTVNLDGVFYCCRAVIPGMIARGYGRVINVASMAGKEGNITAPAYSAAKAGVIGLSKSLGRELGRTGVLVNAVAPGMIDTPMQTKTTAAAPGHVDEILRRTPMGRLGRTEEFAALVAWMASAECGYTTGFTFDLSGGRATY